MSYLPFTIIFYFFEFFVYYFLFVGDCLLLDIYYLLYIIY